MGKEHRVPRTQFDLINQRLEHLAEQHRKFRSAARSPTVPIIKSVTPYDVFDLLPQDPMEGLHVIDLNGGGWVYHGGDWALYRPNRWIYCGTNGVDGVDAQLAANPHPYATGDDPGPPPFQNGWSNAHLEDVNGNPGDGLRVRDAPHGVQVDCGGGIEGGGDNTIVTTFPILIPSPKPGLDALLDGAGGFTWQYLETGDLVYLAAL